MLTFPTEDEEDDDQADLDDEYIYDFHPREYTIIVM